MSCDDVRELDTQLRRLLGEVRAGRITATGEDRARLEGAVTVLGVILGRDNPGTLPGVTNP